jgi:hypothetical protein
MLRAVGFGSKPPTNILRAGRSCEIPMTSTNAGSSDDQKFVLPPDEEPLG